MRELRKDVEATIDSPKEELVDNIDEIKIEEVLMGLKGLKQEEVFSFLGKNNFTPAETEEWLKMMTSSGFGNYDQLAGVDPADIEQLQLSFDGNFDGFQGSNGHVQNGAYLQKNSALSRISDTRMKFRTDANTSAQKSSIFPTNVNHPVDSFCDWSARKDKTDDGAFMKQNNGIKLPSLDFRRTSSVWPKHPGTPVTYSLADGYLENLREEEIISTPMTDVSSEIMQSGNLEDEFRYPVNNTYVIQSSDGVESIEVPDKPKPIKLLIKRVENEEEVCTTVLESSSDTTREKSKRIRNPCTKRKFVESLPPPKKKRCTRKPPSKPKEKTIEPPSIPKKKQESFEEFDFPFSTTVHQDDDFVYPSLDLSDDEEDDVYSFGQRGDETWTPKIKMKINEVKPTRPTRDRKTKSAVAKCLEAAAMKRADSDSVDETTKRKKCMKKCPNKKLPRSMKKPNTISMASINSTLSIDSDITGDLIIDDSVVTNSSNRDCAFNNINAPSNSQYDYNLTYSVPSTSNVYSTPSSSYSGNNQSSESSIDTSPESSPTKPKVTKSKGKPGVKAKAKNCAVRSRLIPPKTCKLIQTPPGTSVSAVQLPVAKRPAKSDPSASCSPSSNGAEKKNSNSYVTKRGKPKKGMATAKQRLGKILKMHKMFF